MSNVYTSRLPPVYIRRLPPYVSLTPSPEHRTTIMRAEAEALADNVKQSMGLLRRHL